MHPKLAIRFAQWLDVDFAVWCDEQITHRRADETTIVAFAMRPRQAARF